MSILYTLVWFTSSITLSMVYRYAGHVFNFNGLMTSSSLFFQGVLVSLYLKRFPTFPDCFDYVFASVVLSQAFYIFLSNLSLQFIPIYIAVVFKCTVPFFNVLLNGKQFSIVTTMFYSLTLSIGLFLSIFNGSFSFKFDYKDYIGYVLCILACFFNVLRFSVLKKYLENTSTHQKTLDVICDTYIFMGIVLTPFGFMSSSQSWDMTSFEWFVGLCWLCTGLGLSLSIGELKVLNGSSVFFTTVLEVLKETILLVGSGVIEHHLKFSNWIGVGFVLCSIIGIKCHCEIESLEEEEPLLQTAPIPIP